jgi:hypothetical protein
MFAKLFATITESSLWSEPKEVRLLFVTMLAKADQDGVVEASIPGLARVANLTIEETETALEVLQSPDPYSKNPDNEGRRIEVFPGGFRLLNYGDYRARRSKEDRREYMRNYMAERRKERAAAKEAEADSSKQSVSTCKQMLTAVSHGKPQLAQAEAEAETEVDKKHTCSAKPRGSSSDEYSEDFIRFWAVFPSLRRKDKRAAWKAWRQAIRRKPAAEIIEAATEYARSETGRGQYVKGPAPWLNADCWDDDRASWFPSRAGQPQTYKRLGD